MNKLLFIGTPQDKAYLHMMKPLVGTATVALLLEEPSTVAEALLVAKKRGISQLVTTSTKLLHKLVDSMALSTTEKLKPKISNYAGSVFVKVFQDVRYEILIVNPLEQLVTVTYGRFILARHLSKFLSPSAWRIYSRFESFDIVTVGSYQNILKRWETQVEETELLGGVAFVACDIETKQQPLAIVCIGYTLCTLDKVHGVRTHSCVLPVDNMEAVYIMRQFNNTPYKKAFQNGKYDISYLARYNASPVNWFFDTATMHHCWYSELPKDLGTLFAFYVRDSMYWKDLATTPNLMEYYKYNALDTYSTALIVLEWLAQAPAWARTNYMQEFPLNFPAHMCEMTGIRVDTQELELAVTEAETEIAKHQSSLERLLGFRYHGRHFNTNSAPQNAALRKVLGCEDITSSDEKSLNKIAYRHPLNARIVNEILEIRGLRKIVSTYLVKEKFFGTNSNKRVLYSLIPHGTDTGRLASREHHFWCGLQIQNVPRGHVVKRIFVADPDFRLAEVDLEQAESRDTAFISGDEDLIVAVTGERDFHSVNASAFFGIPYESIFDAAVGKTINKALRDLAKRVNHGANYNMGPNVLVDTMGLVNIYKAAKLLKLPKLWTPKQIAEYLLAQFHKTYPKIARVYYEWIKAAVRTTAKIVSSAVHSAPYQATTAGWVRYCFGDPTKNKTALNAYVAHAPQSLNAMTLNKAFMAVFYDLMLHPEHHKNIKVFAQIHDSILFQVRNGHEYLIDEVRKRMEIPVTVKSCDGKVREFTVPAAPKAGKDGKGAYRWSETE